MSPVPSLLFSRFQCYCYYALETWKYCNEQRPAQALYVAAKKLRLRTIHSVDGCHVGYESECDVFILTSCATVGGRRLEEDLSLVEIKFVINVSLSIFKSFSPSTESSIPNLNLRVKRVAPPAPTRFISHLRS